MANKTSLAVRNAAQQEDRAGRGIRAARRTMMYIVRTMLLVVVGVLVCVLAFFTAERMANLYILATEGMSLRAAYILDQDAEMSELEEYFMLTFLAEDDVLTADAYGDYKISSYDYDLAIEKISVLPWTATATVTVVETVSVKGTFDKEKLQEGETADDHPLPAFAGILRALNSWRRTRRWNRCARRTRTGRLAPWRRRRRHPR